MNRFQTFFAKMNEPSRIERIYHDAFLNFDQKRAAPLVSVEFYAYVGLRHTIRIRDGKVLVRLSDLTRNADEAVQRALAQILVAKILKRAIPKAAQTIYKNFVESAGVAANAIEQRRARSRKIVGSARGAVYDLDEIFRIVNQNYFQNQIPAPVLSWSQRKTRRIFGHHDALHETVVISQTLDDQRVPRFVVEFVMYHELLHIKHPTRVVNGRRQIHTAAFRRDEREFPNYSEAEKWLQKLARQKR